MHIKSITLSGFKSYRDPVTIELDRHHNIIIGRNGYGKSNIFDGIRFVFGDQFGAMRVDDKTRLIFDQGNAQYIQANVTITLDNSDGRLPVEGSSVTVGRTVGLKKDEFFLGGKSVKKADIQSILESAGFSRSNPYYIIAQGKVAELTKMTAKDRLELIKAVAGTHVYEEKRSESLRILEQSDAKRSEIHEIVTTIDSRLNELEGERDELAAYQRLDRTRRALEYCLYSSELKKASEELDALSRTREEEGGKLGELRATADAQTSQISALEAEVKALAAKVRSLEADKRAATDAVPRTAHKRVKLASRVSELESRAAADGETRSRLGAEAVALASRIATVRAALDATAPGTVGSARAAAEAAYASVKAELQSVTDAMDAIYDKQGRGKRFKSVKERNAHLASLAQAAQEEKAAKLAAAAAADKEAAAAASKGSKAAAALAAARKEMGAQQAKESELASASESQATARTDADAARKSAWARQQELEATLRSARERASAAERAMHQATPPPVRSGLESVRTLMEHAAKAAAGGAGDAAAQGAGAASGAAAAGGKKGKGAQAAAAAAAPGAGALPVIPGIFGALIDLVKPTHARYNTAVDVAAATQLLNVVVDTDMTAKAVIDHLQATRGGRVTLVPLNRVSAPYNIQYPKSDDCRPLIQFLTYDKRYEGAVQQVFGRVLLCRSLEVAAAFAKQDLGLTCITLDGDMVNKKGAVQGGYREPASSRLVHSAAIAQAAGEIAAATGELATAAAAALAADQRMSQLRGEEQRVSSERSAARDAVRRLGQDIERSQRDADAAVKAEEAARAAAAAARSSSESLGERLAALQSEMASELTSTLSAADEAQLALLSARADELKGGVTSAASALEAARNEATKLQSELDLKLLKRQAEIGAVLGKSAPGAGAAGSSAAAASPDETSDELRAARAELAAARAAEEAAARVLGELEASLASSTETLTSRRSTLESLRSEASRVAEAIAGESVAGEKVLERRRMALRKKEECAGKLRELGTLPTAEIDAWSGKRKRDLITSLSETNEGLKGYAHVNKKAADQFASFAGEREALLERVSELDRSDASIRDLVKTLDARKDEAISRTFKGVAHHFKQVFGELIPKGSASMTILTHGLDSEEDAEQDAEELDTDGGDGNEEEGEGGKGASSSSGKKGKKGGKKASTGGATPKRGASSAVAELRNAVETYSGLKIQASFTDAGESGKNSLLSGGQMALVSLALIFAIQRTDPAPFYLLDEIDAALDLTYRAAVAALIKKQAYDAESPAQFISTTFKSELLEAGDKWLAVTMQNKVSRVTELSMSDAAEFLRRIPDAERDVGLDSVSARGAASTLGRGVGAESAASGATPAGKGAAAGGSGPGPAAKKQRTSTGTAAAAAPVTAAKARPGRAPVNYNEGGEDDEEGGGEDRGSVGSSPSGDEPL